METESQIIDDYDSDDFSAQDFEALDNTVEEVQTQQLLSTSPALKQQKLEPVTPTAQSSWDCMTVGLPHTESDTKAAGEVKVLEDAQLPTVALPSGDETKLGDQWASVCLVVRNIEKHVLLLPRQYAMVGGEEQTDQPVSLTDVYTEFNTQVARKHKIMEFKSRSVSRKYAFHLPGVPVEADYLEKLTPPPLSTMTLNLRIAVNPKTLHNEVVMASCLLSPQFPVDQPPQQPFFKSHFCIVTRPSECAFPHDYHSTMGKNSGFKATTLHRVDSERALLSLLLTLIFRADPDLLVGHDIANFDLPTLLARLAAHKVENWSRLGRLRRSGLLQHQQNCMKSNIGSFYKLGSVGIAMVFMPIFIYFCKEGVGVGFAHDQMLTGLHSEDDVRAQRHPTGIADHHHCSSGTTLRNLVCLSMQDAAYILRMMCELNAIPLALQITTIAGNVMSRTLMGGRSERNEFLLLHAFDERGYVVPDKVYGAKQKIQAPEEGDEEGEEGGGSKKARRKKAAYSGGLVLEPKKGFYDNFILLMDFNSLYPSIIQEYNICFTTLVAAKVELHFYLPNLRASTDEDLGGDDGMEELLASVAAAQAAPPGVLPMEIKKLVDKRRAVKGLLARGNLPTEEKMQLNIRQMALKLTANSMYGCLGFSHSRFYAKHLAALVTDSIMINTRSTSYDEVLKLGFKVKGEVNKLYQSVELEVDGIFKYLLLLKKKKYAALTISRLPDGSFRTEQELKGLDIVRRDWAPLAADTGRLSELRGQLERGEVPPAQLAVAKTLARNPDQYQDKKGLPHVLVAARLNAKGGRRLKQGDTVHYVICNVECLDGTDAVRIAECLGLDAANYKHAIRREEEDQEGFKQISQFSLPEEERFKHCERFKFKCQGCNEMQEMKSAWTEGGWLVCEDPRCSARSRGINNKFQGQLPVCRKCNQGTLLPEVSFSCARNHFDRNEHDLHQQIYYYRFIFTLSKRLVNATGTSRDTEAVYLKLREQAEKVINLSSYCVVDLTSLFRKLQTKKSTASSHAC
ncbi:hypothetical protein B566_EDAN014305 [Ephemera danica]|nr:hypothetical protein B566_EDAN014305 [Ephemera danica]